MQFFIFPEYAGTDLSRFSEEDIILDSIFTSCKRIQTRDGRSGSAKATSVQ